MNGDVSVDGAARTQRFLFFLLFIFLSFSLSSSAATTEAIRQEATKRPAQDRQTASHAVGRESVAGSREGLGIIAFPFFFFILSGFPLLFVSFRFLFLISFSFFASSLLRFPLRFFCFHQLPCPLPRARQVITDHEPPRSILLRRYRHAETFFCISLFPLQPTAFVENRSGRKSSVGHKEKLV